MRALVGTGATARGQRHLDDPRLVARTSFVDTTGYPLLDLDLDRPRVGGVGSAWSSRRHRVASTVKRRWFGPRRGGW